MLIFPQNKNLHACMKFCFLWTYKITYS